jgi:hypothetical protein
MPNLSAQIPADSSTAVVPIFRPAPEFTPPPPPAPKALPAFTVEATATQRVANHKVVMVRVVDPKLPDPPAPPPPMTPEQLDALRASPEWQQRVRTHKEARMLFLTAHVYDHQWSRISWFGPGPFARPFAAWSNVDFNHFAALSGFDARGVRHVLLLGLGNIDTTQTKKRLETSGQPYRPPQIPALPRDKSAFVLVEGDPDDADGMAPIRALHEIHQGHRDQLVALCADLERARVARAAWYRARPPVPQDTVIHFWPRHGSRRTSKDAAAESEP